MSLVVLSVHQYMRNTLEIRIANDGYSEMLKFYLQSWLENPLEELQHLGNVTQDAASSLKRVMKLSFAKRTEKLFMNLIL